MRLAMPGSSHSADLPSRHHAQKEKQPAISASAAAAKIGSVMLSPACGTDPVVPHKRADGKEPWVLALTMRSVRPSRLAPLAPQDEGGWFSSPSCRHARSTTVLILRCER